MVQKNRQKMAGLQICHLAEFSEFYQKILITFSCL